MKPLKLELQAFGPYVEKQTVDFEKLAEKEYEYFVNLVVELGTKTAKYIKETLYLNCEAKDNIDPNLSIKHISGLADYITEDTILDVKVRNNIDEKCVRQVLAYHYLSTKRSDLNIKRLIIYDAVSGKSVTINMDDIEHEIEDNDVSESSIEKVFPEENLNKNEIPVLIDKILDNKETEIKNIEVLKKDICAAPVIEEETKDIVFNVGDFVEHKKFKIGKIIKINNENKTLEIKFDKKYGTKKFNFNEINSEDFKILDSKSFNKIANFLKNKK